MILTPVQYREMTKEAADLHSDTDITLALNRYTSLIEGFVGRSFQAAPLRETFYDCAYGPLRLSRYPISGAPTVLVDGAARDLSAYDIHHSAGLIYHYGALQGQDVVVEYTGGYSEVPYNIKVVLSTLVQAYLSGSHGGVDTLNSGRKEVVAGVGSIDYGNPVTQIASYGAPYAELGPYVSVLERYREPSLA